MGSAGLGGAALRQALARRRRRHGIVNGTLRRRHSVRSPWSAVRCCPVRNRSMNRRTVTQVFAPAMQNPSGESTRRRERHGGQRPRLDLALKPSAVATGDAASIRSPADRFDIIELIVTRTRVVQSSARSISRRIVNRRRSRRSIVR